MRCHPGWQRFQRDRPAPLPETFLPFALRVGAVPHLVISMSSSKPNEALISLLGTL
jgi:hypothetical protein